MSNNFLVCNDILYINNIDTTYFFIKINHDVGYYYYNGTIEFNSNGSESLDRESLKFKNIKKIVMNGCKVTNAVFNFGETDEPINISFNSTKIEYTLMLSKYKLLISEDSHVKNIVLPNESDYCDHYNGGIFYVLTYVRLSQTLFIIENQETEKNEIVSFSKNENDLTNFKNVIPYVF